MGLPEVILRNTMLFSQVKGVLRSQQSYGQEISYLSYNSQDNYNIYRNMPPDSVPESGGIQPEALKPILLQSYLTLLIQL